MDPLVKKLIESFGGSDKMLSEDASKQLNEMLTSFVEEKVKDKTAELEAKTKELDEGYQLALSETEKSLLGECEKTINEMLSVHAQKESIMFEAIDRYKTETTGIAVDVSKQYKNAIAEEASRMIAEHQEQIQNASMDVVRRFKESHLKQQKQNLLKEVQAFKEDMLSKTEQYLSEKISKIVPNHIMESAVENAALKPLVEGFVGVMNNNYLDVDASGMKTLKKAKDDNRCLSESVNSKTKENMKLSGQVKKLEKELKISKLIEGLSHNVKGKARTILESKSSKDIDNEWSKIKDTLINESVTAPKRTKATDKKVLAEKIEAKKIEATRVLSESKKVPTGVFDNEIASWAANMRK